MVLLVIYDSEPACDSFSVCCPMTATPVGREGAEKEEDFSVLGDGRTSKTIVAPNRSCWHSRDSRRPFIDIDI